jgi:hypothetical protein
VVCDFRTADVAAGGEGGPLARIHHRALVRRLAAEPPVAVLNVGGVANVTYIDRDALITCDTGPSNALVDDFLRLRTDRLLDTDGRMAQAGAIDKLSSRGFWPIRSSPSRCRSRSTATISASRSERRLTAAASRMAQRLAPARVETADDAVADRSTRSRRRSSLISRCAVCAASRSACRL